AVIWPGIVLLGLLPLAVSEWLLQGMMFAPIMEVKRVRAASRSARVMALAVITFAGLNYVGSLWSKKTDLSYFKTSKPGESTLALVKQADKPLRMVLFFPPGNDVAEEAKNYVSQLQSANDFVQMEIADQAVDIELAKELKMRANGYIAIRYGEQSRDLFVGLELEQAREKLK